MSHSQLPTEDHVQSLLTSLFGDEVQVRVVDAPKLDETSTVLAFYVDDEGVVSKLLACDLALACRFGAALTRIPSGTVDEAVKSKVIPENIRENLHEVLNICVNIFPAKNGTRFVLDKIVVAGGSENEISINPTEREEAIAFEVDIPRYGAGILSLEQVSSVAARVTS